MAAAACLTCSRNEVPPTPVPSIQRGTMPSACATWTGPGAETVAIPSMSRVAQAGVADRVDGGLQVQGQRGVAGQLADLIGLGRARDDDARRAAHGADPCLTGVNIGRYTSPRGSNVTRSGMSSTRSSGVLGTPTRLVIIRGPSASSTTAMA